MAKAAAAHGAALAVAAFDIQKLGTWILVAVQTNV